MLYNCLLSYNKIDLEFELSIAIFVAALLSSKVNHRVINTRLCLVVYP